MEFKMNDFQLDGKSSVNYRCCLWDWLLRLQKSLAEAGATIVFLITYLLNQLNKVWKNYRAARD